VPQRQRASGYKIDNQHYEKYALAQALRVKREAKEQYDPDDIGRGGPEVVRPFVLVVGDVRKGNPSEVGTANEPCQAP
jgi:hypothetical protein